MSATIATGGSAYSSRKWGDALVRGALGTIACLGFGLAIYGIIHAREAPTHSAASVEAAVQSLPSRTNSATTLDTPAMGTPVAGNVSGASAVTFSAFASGGSSGRMMTSTGAGWTPATLPVQAVRPIPSVQPFTFDESGLAEYRAVAAQVGAVPAELTIADFRTFLADHKIPTFGLAKVVGYMDKIAASDNPDRLGWHWAPLRASDARDINLGAASVGYSCNNCVMVGATNQANGTMVWQSGGGGGMYSQQSAASDYYAASKTPYARTIPLHALQLIAMIEQQFGVGKVAFMISDYTTQPDRIVTPDPFLMAIIPNDKLAKGEGRFIIDAWDEPGFGVGPKDSVTAP